MRNSFLPSKDAELLSWSANFKTLITAAPTTYGLTAAQATAYTALHTAFATALTTATEPTTRTTVTVAAKDSARASLKNSARFLAKIVEGTSTVTDAQKIALGLNVRAQPTPVPVPSESPDIDIVGINGRTVTIRVHKTGALKRGKPAGVKGSTVFSYVGSAPPDNIAAWKFEGSTTKTVFEVAFPDTLAAGSQVWLTAFWFNTKSESGPACTPVTTYLAGGLSSMAA